MLWWPVLISGFGVMSISEARGTVTLSKRISLRIHHNGKSTDFEQTLRAGTTINLNALTCCVLWLPVLLATSVITTTDAIYTGELLRTTTVRALIASTKQNRLFDYDSTLTVALLR